MIYENQNVLNEKTFQFERFSKFELIINHEKGEWSPLKNILEPDTDSVLLQSQTTNTHN